eukprot:TRINITY_DN67851_c2_g2_i1.p1 TRINITY_DN67851_c2_g2~~TRINITY_DN67851_c2_g2_i1.p1  ORF type:complete len:291 (+),score=45.54 TRINITY_DN67851_c2_g2_i1:32-904(+)
MAKVGFVGLGLMGALMAERLCKAGIKVHVWSRTASKVEKLTKEQENAVGHATWESLLDAVDVVYSMLDTGATCASVFLSSPDKLKGKLIVNNATIGVTEVTDLHAKITGNGGKYLSTPVLGSLPTIPAGKLQLLAAGDKALYEQEEATLKLLGIPRFMSETITDSMVYKLALNNIIASQVAAFATSMGLLQKNNLSTDTFMEIARAGPFMSPYFEYKYQGMKDRNFEPAHFSAGNMAKDLGLVYDAAQGSGMDTAILQAQQGCFKKESERHTAKGQVLDMGSVLETLAPM